MLEANLRALEQHHPRLARRLTGGEELPGAALDTGARDSRSEALYALEQCNLASAEACVVLGLGTGELAEAVLQRVLPGTRVVVAEASPLATRQALESRSIERALGRADLRVGELPRSLAREITEQLGPLVMQSCTAIVEDARATAQAPDYYAQLRAALETEFREASCRLAPGLRQAARSLQALLANLPALSRSLPLERLTDRFRQRPALVLGPAANPTPAALEAARSAGAVTVGFQTLAGPETLPHLLLVPTGAESASEVHEAANHPRLLVARVTSQPDTIVHQQRTLVASTTPDEPGRLADRLLGPLGTLRARRPLAAAAELLLMTGARPVVVTGFGHKGNGSGRVESPEELRDELDALGLATDQVQLAESDDELLQLMGRASAGMGWDSLDETLSTLEPTLTRDTVTSRLALVSCRARDLARAAARAGWRLDAARALDDSVEASKLVGQIEQELLAPRDLLSLIECLRPLEGLEVRRQVAALAREARGDDFGARAARTWAGIAARLALGAAELADELESAGKQTASAREPALLRTSYHQPPAP